MIVAGDGNAYVPYMYFSDTTETSSTQQCRYWVDAHSMQDLAFFTRHIEAHLLVPRVATDGTYAKIPLKNFTWDSTCVANTATPSQFPSDPTVSTGSLYLDWLSVPSSAADKTNPSFSLPVITNADQGVAVIWPQPICAPSCSADEPPPVMSLITQDSASPQINIPDGFVPSLQREDGSYIGTGEQNELMAVALNGTPIWSTKINPDANGNATAVKPLYATADGGAIVTSTITGGNGDTQLGTLYTVDKDGNMTGQEPDAGAVLSWTGNWYLNAPNAQPNMRSHFTHSSLLATGVSSELGANGMISLISLPIVNRTATYAYTSHGNPSKTDISDPAGSLRLVPYSDCGGGTRERQLIYELLDLSKQPVDFPTRFWYVSEHQTNKCIVSGCSGITTDTDYYIFRDTVGGGLPGSKVVESKQTFTIAHLESQPPGKGPLPPGTVNLPVIVRVPASDGLFGKDIQDFGELGIYLGDIAFIQGWTSYPRVF